MFVLVTIALFAGALANPACPNGNCDGFREVELCKQLEAPCRAIYFKKLALNPVWKSSCFDDAEFLEQCPRSCGFCEHEKAGPPQWGVAAYGPYAHAGYEGYAGYQGYESQLGGYNAYLGFGGVNPYANHNQFPAKAFGAYAPVNEQPKEGKCCDLADNCEDLKEAGWCALSARTGAEFGGGTTGYMALRCAKTCGICEERVAIVKPVIVKPAVEIKPIVIEPVYVEPVIEIIIPKKKDCTQARIEHAQRMARKEAKALEVDEEFEEVIIEAAVKEVMKKKDCTQARKEHAEREARKEAVEEEIEDEEEIDEMVKVAVQEVVDTKKHCSKSRADKAEKEARKEALEQGVVEAAVVETMAQKEVETDMKKPYKKEKLAKEAAAKQAKVQVEAKKTASVKVDKSFEKPAKMSNRTWKKIAARRQQYLAKVNRKDQ